MAGALHTANNTRMPGGQSAAPNCRFEASVTWFTDCREVSKGAFQNNWNPNWCVTPDEIVDFRSMPYQSNSFNMVVFDPPHLTSGSMKSVINKKYGLLNKQTWKQDIVDGFKECWRVLAVNGVLIFKWNEANIKAKELLREFGVEPLFGDFTGKTAATIWVTFFKTEESPVLGEESPAQDTMEICHTAPNSASMQNAQVELDLL